MGGGLGSGGKGEGEGGEKLTAWNYARLSGREDVTERVLRVAQNRYLMHRSYSDGLPKLGVLDKVVSEEVVGSKVVREQKL